MKIYYYILTALLMTAVSCSSSDEPDPSLWVSGEGSETCEIVVSLQAESTLSPVSRRSAANPTWGEPYPEEIGLPDESRIENLYLYLVTPGNVVCPLYPSQVGETDGVYKYKATVDLKGDYISRDAEGGIYMNARIVAMANMPEDMPASPFTYSPTSTSIIADKKIIPMWGVTSVTNFPLVKDETVDVPQQIKMLRSVPKFTFQLAEDIQDDYIITAVSSPDKEFELTAFCQPSGITSLQFTSDLSVEGCFHPAEGPKGELTQFYGVGTNKVWTYTAERNCTLGADGLPPFFYVTVAMRDNPKVKFTGKVYLCDYTQGAPNYATAYAQIVRNHDYQYVISLAELEFVVSFREWIPGGKVHIQL